MMIAGVDTQVIEIMVTGLPTAGKTSLVKTISQRTNYGSGATTGWLCGHLPVNEDFAIKFLEPPAVDDFDFIWIRDLIIDADVPGFIVMCDSARPESFNEMIGILQTVRIFHPDVPCVLVANKQDQSGSWRVDDIRIGLGIPDDILVVPCVATERRSVKDVVVKLLYEIFS